MCRAVMGVVVVRGPISETYGGDNFDVSLAANDRVACIGARLISEPQHQSSLGGSIIGSQGTPALAKHKYSCS